MRTAFMVLLAGFFMAAISSCSDRNRQEQEAITLMRNEMVYLNQRDSLRQLQQQQTWEKKLAELQSSPDTANSRHPIYGLQASLRGYRLSEKILTRIKHIQTAIRTQEKSNPVGVVNLTADEIAQLELVEKETGRYIYLHQKDEVGIRKDTSFYFGIFLVSRDPQKNWITKNINQQPLAIADLFFVSLRRKLYATRQEFINRAVSDSDN